jgi:hypothetical protein
MPLERPDRLGYRSDLDYVESAPNNRTPNCSGGFIEAHQAQEASRAPIAAGRFRVCGSPALVASHPSDFDAAATSVARLALVAHDDVEPPATESGPPRPARWPVRYSTHSITVLPPWQWIASTLSIPP